MKQANICHVCESAVKKVYKKVNNFWIYSCYRCGLKWVDVADAEEIVSFYDERYFNNNSKIGYKNYLADEKNHRRNARTIISLVDKVQHMTGLRILDVGCALGFLLDEARKLKDSDVYGTELSQYACEYANKQLGLNIIKSQLESAGFKAGFFDIVFLIGTIEHLLSPKDTLTAVNKILKTGGLLVITTIDTKGLLPFYSVKPPEHLFYFNHNNLSTLLCKLGFKILTGKTYFVCYYFHDLLYRLGKFLSWRFLNSISNIIKTKLPNIYFKIPTNEMIVIARKLDVP
jgi:2-polyprenyl-3-methyl-5-hydroxy-6-metoxy-1,4-benzoquinol methylase